MWSGSNHLDHGVRIQIPVENIDIDKHGARAPVNPEVLFQNLESLSVQEIKW